MSNQPCPTCGTPSIKSRRSCCGCGMRPGRLHNNGLCATCQHPVPSAPTTPDAELDERLALAEYRREQADWTVES